MKIYDISVPITPSLPVWPGDPPVDFQSLSSIQNGDSSNVTQIQISVHTGTHIDAPKHFLDEGGTIGQIPMEKLIGDALVVEIDPSVNVITDDILENHPQNEALRNAKKVLFKTKNSRLWWLYPHEFQTDYVGIDTSAAELLAEMNLDLIGVDYLSVAPYHNTKAPHLILLSKAIVLLEGIDLSSVPAGFYKLFCLPIALNNCEGAPVRAILTV